MGADVAITYAFCAKSGEKNARALAETSDAKAKAYNLQVDKY